MKPATYLAIVNANTEKRVKKLRRLHSDDPEATALCDTVLVSCYGYERRKQNTEDTYIDPHPPSTTHLHFEIDEDFDVQT